MRFLAVCYGPTTSHNGTFRRSSIFDCFSLFLLDRRIKRLIYSFSLQNILIYSRISKSHSKSHLTCYVMTNTL